jgi:Type IV secretion system pilin
MIKTLKKIGVAMIMAVSVLVGTVFLAPAPTASAAACTDQSSILTFPNWYRGVYTNTGTECNIEFKNGINDTWVIVTNIVEILIQAVGYVAVGFIIYGGFKYITSQGESAGVTEAKNTITRAVVGLVISIVSVLILNVVVGIFGLRTSGDCSEIQSGTSTTTVCGTSGAGSGNATGTATGTDTTDESTRGENSRGGRF